MCIIDGAGGEVNGKKSNTKIDNKHKYDYLRSGNLVIWFGGLSPGGSEEKC